MIGLHWAPLEAIEECHWHGQELYVHEYKAKEMGNYTYLY